MKPGQATLLSASTVSTAAPSIRFPIAVIFPFFTPISPQNQGFPMPVTILAFFMITSNITRFPFYFRIKSDALDDIPEARIDSVSQDITDEIEEMVPFYNHLSSGGTERGEAELGDIGDSSPGTRRLYKGLFPSGFGRFSPVEYVPSPPSDGYPHTLIAGSVRYGFGSGGRSSRSARLSRYNGDGYLDINAADAKKLGIGDGDTVKIISPHGELVKPARIAATLPQGLVFTPVASPGGNVAELFSTVLDRQSKAPAVKSCAVRLERV